MITINKQTLYYWLIIFILQVVFIAWYQGLLAPDTIRPDPAPPIPIPDIVIPTPVPEPDELVMSAMQAKLTKQAIEMIRDDVVRGQIRTADLAIQALSALLPSSIRECVIQELGTPDIEYMRDALDILDGKIIIQE